MREQRPHEDRVCYLAMVLYEFMASNDFAASQAVYYDGVECDGMCLADDFINSLNIDWEE